MPPVPSALRGGTTSTSRRPIALGERTASCSGSVSFCARLTSNERVSFTGVSRNTLMTGSMDCTAREADAAASPGRICGVPTSACAYSAMIRPSYANVPWPCVVRWMVTVASS